MIFEKIVQDIHHSIDEDFGVFSVKILEIRVHHSVVVPCWFRKAVWMLAIVEEYDISDLMMLMKMFDYQEGPVQHSIPFQCAIEIKNWSSCKHPAHCALLPWMGLLPQLLVSLDELAHERHLGDLHYYALLVMEFFL